MPWDKHNPAPALEKVRHMPRRRRRLVWSRPTVEALEPKFLLTNINTNPDGGNVLANVAVESVFYGQAWTSPSLSDQRSYINGFLGYITNSPFMDMLSPYGVGRGTFTAGPAGTLTGLSGATSITDAQIQEYLAQGISSGSLLPYQAGTLYMVYTPPGVEVTLNSQDSEDDFDGYHQSFKNSAIADDEPIPYAVIPYPGQGNVLHATEGVQGQLTRDTSHELAESATDPFLDAWKDYQTVPAEEIADEVEGYDAFLDGYTIAAVADPSGLRIIPAGAVNFLIAPATVLDFDGDGTSTGVVATFLDGDSTPGPLAATISYGNGQTAAGTVLQTAPGQFSVTASLTGIDLENGQNLPLSVQIVDQTDGETASASDSAMVVVTPTSTPTTPTTPIPTQPPPPAPPPMFLSALLSSSGKGKKKMYHGQIFFTAPLDPTTADIAGNYHVTQKISKRKSFTVPVRAATFSAAKNSVTLVLGTPKPGKAMQVTVSGLRGAGGTLVGTFIVGL